MTELKNSLAVVDKDLIEIILLIHCIFNCEKKTLFWLKTKNLHFGYIAPLKLIQLGKTKKVIQFVKAAADGD